MMPGMMLMQFALFLLIGAAPAGGRTHQPIAIRPFRRIASAGPYKVQTIRPGVVAFAEYNPGGLKFWDWRKSKKLRDLHDSRGLNILGIAGSHFWLTLTDDERNGIDYSVLNFRDSLSGRTRHQQSIRMEGANRAEGTGLASTPDGSKLAIGQWQSVVLVSSANRRIQRRLSGFEWGFVDTVALSPDGHLVAGMTWAMESGDREVCVWNTLDGTLLYHRAADNLKQSSIYDNFKPPLVFTDSCHLICGGVMIRFANHHYRTSLLKIDRNWSPLEKIPGSTNLFFCVREADGSVSIWNLDSCKQVSPAMKLIGAQTKSDWRYPAGGWRGAIAKDGVVAVVSSKGNSLLLYHLPIPSRD